MPVARGVKTGIIGTVAVGMLAVAGFGAYNIYSGLDNGSDGGDGGGTANVAQPVATPVSAQDISSTATDFLTAWSSGDIASAAKLTDSVQTATAALTAYKTQAHVTSVQIVPGTPILAKVPFTVNATLSYPGVPSTPWSYSGSLSVGRNAAGKPAVTWAPSVLHPDLQAGDKLVTGPAKAPEVDVVDRNGKVLDAAKYPSLTQILKQLQSRYAATLHAGTPGIETYIEGADGSQTKTLDVLRKGKNAQLKTTLDAGIQAAAEKAVAKQPDTAGVSALDTRTGGILAVAFNPPTGTDHALQDPQAPGSTFKIVTATALFNAGLKPSTSSPCKSPDNVNQGKMYTNVSGNNPSATLQWDFEQSCNTGFIKQVDHISSGTLTTTGATYFGIGPAWYVGTSTDDGSIPGGTGDELTSEMIGQGKVVMTPLNMASVSATVREGVFHQPTILQDSSVIDKRTSIGTTPLPPGIKQSLQQMMHGTVTEGTARGAMSGLSGKVGAKTGSAEAGNVQPNGWFTAYRDHVSAAAVVLQGGHGGDSAGPIVAAVLGAS
ncbi:penicillin-binding transpeptidase domain-containing protein [Streptomyces sp. NBC_01476]|uniref:penicillin-binding transpeptidase domain-containing protein n=1 Tax=Streptomyces sp. NBC_01476 TaxID=2903881 RepID=UPI002E36601F|nr:penicillin-binding transpeptidase domain-containing protein [Streptomyces sp. NBC_01476]